MRTSGQNPHHRHRAPLLCLLALLCTPGLSALAAESWPQAEAGAEASGFSAAGIDQLDRAMREIVANQDVAGMVWLSMIQAQGQRRPGAANAGVIARDLIYDALVD